VSEIACPHAERRDGVCVACGNCAHDVVLNGACLACGTTELDPIAMSRRSIPAPEVIAAERLVRRK
jgi:hypothetical protein